MSETREIYDAQDSPLEGLILDSNGKPELLLIGKEVTTTASDSIELTKGSKDSYNWTVKVYFQPDGEADALSRLASIDQTLRDKYGAKSE